MDDTKGKLGNNFARRCVLLPSCWGSVPTSGVCLAGRTSRLFNANGLVCSFFFNGLFIQHFQVVEMLVSRPSCLSLFLPFHQIVKYFIRFFIISFHSIFYYFISFQLFYWFLLFNFTWLFIIIITIVIIYEWIDSLID